MAMYCVCDAQAFKDREERVRAESFFPGWFLTMGLSGTEKQVALYKRLIEEKTSRHRGRVLHFGGDIGKNLNEVVPGASQGCIRMYGIYGAASYLVAVIPFSKIRTLWDITSKIIEKHYFRDPIDGTPFSPFIALFPYDRGRVYYFEVDLFYEPVGCNESGIKETLRSIRKEWLREAFALGGSLPSGNPGLMRRLMPSYFKLLSGIKGMVDPNGILAPGRLI